MPTLIQNYFLFRCEKNILGKEIQGFEGSVGHRIVGWEKKEKIEGNKVDAILK